MTILLLQNLGFAWGDTAAQAQTLSMWHDTGRTSWDQGDGVGDVVPQIRRDVDIGQVIQSSGGRS